MSVSTKPTASCLWQHSAWRSEDVNLPKPRPIGGSWSSPLIVEDRVYIYACWIRDGGAPKIHCAASLLVGRPREEEKEKDKEKEKERALRRE
ncbi:MAG: hypothetical protein WD342_07875 [Verrucomicrobiales bacterium]